MIRAKLILWKFPRLDISIQKRINKARLRDSSRFAPKTADSHVDIVIEGFPRSANTFFTYMILMQSHEKLSVAHHIHTPSQYYYAAKNKTKAILLIRKPIDAVTSLLVRDPKITPESAFKLYHGFYTIAIKHLKELSPLIITFDEIVNDTALARVEKYIGTEYIIQKKSIKNAVFKEIEKRSAVVNGSLNENMIARPSVESLIVEGKLKTKQRIIAKVDPFLQKKCEDIYTMITNNKNLF